MNSFEMSRFANFFKWHVATHKSEIIRQTGYAAIAMFLIIRIFDMGSYFSSMQSNPPIHIGFVTIAIVFAMYVAAASVFKDINKKEGYINLSMAPASVLEKYLTLLIYCTVLPFLLLILSYFIAEILNVLLFYIEGNQVQRIFIIDLLKVFVKTETEITLFGIFYMSLYVLGGSIFRKMPFLSTSAVIIAFMIFVTPWLGSALLSPTMDIEDYEHVFKFIGENTELVRWAVRIAVLLLSILNFYISYRIFKRMQVINNKWINL